MFGISYALEYGMANEYTVVDRTNGITVGRGLSLIQAENWMRSYQLYFPNRVFEIRPVKCECNS